MDPPPARKASVRLIPLRLPLFVISLALASSVGCASAGSWNYTPMAEKISSAPVSRARVAVLPFSDQRGDENSNYALIYMIPLVPVGPFEYERIESGSGYLTHASYQIRPGEDLAKAVVEELKRANLFEEVFYTEREREPNVDLYLHGSVTDMTYSGGIISYGLSVYGPLLWFLGLPAGYTTNSLEVGLELRSPAGETVWRSPPFSDEWKVTMGLYYNWGDEFNGYAQMMQEAARRWVEGLQQHLDEIQLQAPSLPPVVRESSDP